MLHAASTVRTPHSCNSIYRVQCSRESIDIHLPMLQPICKCILLYGNRMLKIFQRPQSLFFTEQHNLYIQTSERRWLLYRCALRDYISMAHYKESFGCAKLETMWNKKKMRNSCIRYGCSPAVSRLRSHRDAINLFSQRRQSISHIPSVCLPCVCDLRIWWSCLSIVIMMTMRALAPTFSSVAAVTNRLADRQIIIGPMIKGKCFLLDAQAHTHAPIPHTQSVGHKGNWHFFPRTWFALDLFSFFLSILLVRVPFNLFMHARMSGGMSSTKRSSNYCNFAGFE